MRPLAVALAILVAGCASNEQRAAADAQRAKADDTTCISYGVKAGSDPYVQCRMMLAQQRHESEAQRRRALGTLSQLPF